MASRTGIDPYDPQTAARNLSTCRLAEELGFDVVVRTELGLHTLPGATQPELGLVMEVAPGVAARDIPHEHRHIQTTPIHAGKSRNCSCSTA